MIFDASMGLAIQQHKSARIGEPSIHQYFGTIANIDGIEIESNERVLQRHGVSLLLGTETSSYTSDTEIVDYFRPRLSPPHSMVRLSAECVLDDVIAISYATKMSDHNRCISFLILLQRYERVYGLVLQSGGLIFHRTVDNSMSFPTNENPECVVEVALR